MSKILLFYRGFRPIIHGFQSLNLEVINFDKYLSLDELKKLGSFKLALFDMYDIVKKPYLFFKVKSFLNKLNCPVIVWNRDGPSNKGEKVWRQFILKNIPLFDIYASHTLQKTGALREKAFYLPNAAFVEEYYQDQDTKHHYDYDVSFIGAIDAKKYPDMKKRVDFLNDLAVRLKSLGISWHFAGEGISLAEQRYIIQSTKINLQYHAGCDTRFRDRKRFERSWGLPERCYGIPACGGFLLSDERKHGLDDFGEDWCFFEDNIEDCVNKVQYYLSNFDLTRQIAERQHQKVLENHTYEHRAKQLLALADEWRASR